MQRSRHLAGSWWCSHKASGTSVWTRQTRGLQCWPAGLVESWAYRPEGSETPPRVLPPCESERQRTSDLSHSSFPLWKPFSQPSLTLLTFSIQVPPFFWSIGALLLGYTAGLWRQDPGNGRDTPLGTPCRQDLVVSFLNAPAAPAALWNLYPWRQAICNLEMLLREGGRNP